MYQHGILVLDFGGPQGRAVARKVRNEQVFCGILPYNAPLEEIRAAAPRGIILAGDSVDAFGPDAMDVQEAVYQMGLPMLGIEYGARIMLKHMGARRIATHKTIGTMQVVFDASELFLDLKLSDRVLDWVDELELPDGFHQIAAAANGLGTAFSNEQSKLYAMQFCPEPNDPDGLRIVHNFARHICGAEANWTSEKFLDWSLEKLREQVADGHALVAISGGVDSAVCAALVHRAIGDRLVLVHIDTGLTRKGECEMVQKHFQARGMGLRVIQAEGRFLQVLGGITCNHEKRAAIYEEYECIVKEAMDQAGHMEFLAQGTIYTDVLDEQDYFGQQREGLLEPLRMLFKEEVRELGAMLGLPAELVKRQAFPGAGLAVRCLGEVTSGKLEMVREADCIMREEIVNAKLDTKIRQYFAVLLDIQTRGAQADSKGYAVALRAVNPGVTGRVSVYRLPYDVLERIVERMTKEVAGVNRVVYDVTGQPPAAVEWD